MRAGALVEYGRRNNHASNIVVLGVGRADNYIDVSHEQWRDILADLVILVVDVGVDVCVRVYVFSGTARGFAVRDLLLRSILSSLEEGRRWAWMGRWMDGAKGRRGGER